MRRALPWLIAGLGAVLAVAGVLVFADANRGPLDFGWTSYAPLEKAQIDYLSAVTFSDGTVLWTGEHLLGAGLLVLGVLVLTGAVAWQLGRRAGRRGTPPA
jgi:heme/copper-type cytochrome/quinol oxidase subunit 1